MAGPCVGRRNPSGQPSWSNKVLICKIALRNLVCISANLELEPLPYHVVAKLDPADMSTPVPSIAVGSIVLLASHVLVWIVVEWCKRPSKPLGSHRKTENEILRSRREKQTTTQGHATEQRCGYRLIVCRSDEHFRSRSCQPSHSHPRGLHFVRILEILKKSRFLSSSSLQSLVESESQL